MRYSRNVQFSITRLYQSLAIVGLILLLLKMTSIGFYSSRFFDIKGAPFTEIGHESFHRFMDWVLVWDVSKYKDFFDITSPEYTAPPVPYSILAFWFLKFGSLAFYNHWNLYILVVASYLYTSYLLFNFIIKSDYKEFKILLFLTLICTSYPLWYAIDRGNFDLIPVILFNIVALNEIKWKKQNLTIASIALIISIKPSWGIFGLALLLYPMSRILLIALGLVAIIYALPMVIWGHGYDYLLVEIRTAYPMISGMNFLCHNLTCAFRGLSLPFLDMAYRVTPTLNPQNIIYDKIITIIGLSSIISWFVYLKFINKNLSFQKKLLVLLTSVYVCTLLINNPSADFRLNIFFALIIYTFAFLKDNVILKNYDYLILFLGYVFVFGFTNIPFKGFFYYFTILRTLGVIFLGYVLLKISLDKSLTLND